MSAGPIYNRIIVAPDDEFVRLVVERGQADWLGPFLGRDLIGFPKQSRISDTVSITVTRAGAPMVAGQTEEGPVVHGEHGATWWSGLDDSVRGEEWTGSVEEANTAYVRLGVELRKRFSEPERRHIYMARWEDGTPVEVDQP